MKVLCQCPSCGAEMIMEKPSKLPLITCKKCAKTAPPTQYREVLTKTIYCPDCSAPFTVRQERQPKTNKCSKCGSTNLTSRYSDTPPAPQQQGPDDGGDTSLGGDLDKMYRPGMLRLNGDEESWAGADRDFTLVRGRNTLGRQSASSSSTIQFPTRDAFMSKNHAAVEVEMKRDATFEHILSDGGSTNGTFHNGNRLSPGDEIILVPGDTVRMGRTTFVFITM